MRCSWYPLTRACVCVQSMQPHAQTLMLMRGICSTDLNVWNFIRLAMSLLMANETCAMR